MRLQRARFAALFVVVIGCGRPASPPSPEPAPAKPPPARPPPPAEPEDGALPAVAGVPPMPVVDASIAPHDAAVVVMGRIINISVTTGGVDVTANKGTRDGVRKGWHARLLDASKRPLAGGDFVISGVKERTCTGTVGVTSDSVRAFSHVELRPQP